MASIVLCYAKGDEVFARRLAAFLEMNLPVAVSLTEGVVARDLDLMEATERALSAEVALVFLSPLSVPKVWNRKIWEPLFFDKPKAFQTLLGFVLVNNCSFPELLRRVRFFDASSDQSQAMREMKRWLLRPMTPIGPGVPVASELEDLHRLVADQPGMTVGIAPELAVEFGTACRDDFEAVYRFDCRGRSRAGITGDICDALGLRSQGTLEENRAMLSEWCIRHRVLFVLAGINAEDRDFVAPGGRASVIFTASAESGVPGAIHSAAADAVRKCGETLRIDIETGLRNGWIAVNLLKAQGRFPEISELLEAMARTARDQGNTSALLRIEREQFWMPDYQSEGGRIPGPSGHFQEEQLTLPFVDQVDLGQTRQKH